MADAPDELLRHFRDAFAADPVAAYRDWYRAQEELRDGESPAQSRALADDLWSFHDALVFGEPGARARFLHNLAVFFGSPGPAADLDRARALFASALRHFASHDEAGWRSRALHNFATALSNLGATPADLEESVALFDAALAWRTSEREIARGVTLHNRGIALRRLAELAPARAEDFLAESAASLEEAAAIRGQNNLVDGRALSLFHLGLTLEWLAATGEHPDAAVAAIRSFDEAARAFESAGKTDSARISAEHREALMSER
jgi:hypothetical protein